MVQTEGSYGFKPSSQKFADFLLYLHQDCHLSASTVKGYKAMLNSVFRLKGFDLSTDQVLQDISKACSCQVKRTISRVLPWNIDVVLRFLLSTPFEQMDRSSFKHLTQKTFPGSIGNGYEGE